LTQDSFIGRSAAQGEFMRRYMKLAFAAGIFVGLGATGVASAADMALKARPVVAPLYNWTGCYIGGNVGGGWTKTDTTRISNDAVGPAVANYGRENDSGFIGGAQVGCDFQTGNLVLGVQGMFDFGNINGRHALTDFPTFTETNSLKSIITGTGRFGYLLQPAFLVYGKFGAAWLRDRNKVFQPNGALAESSSFTVPGMTVGIGGEWMFAPNWSVFAEYNYMWFLDDTATQFTPTPGNVGEVINVRQKAQTALVGVNYKFHWDGPVVAKH
jgi:outer membrane immunogenic protein